jgi:hypothetical protein
VRLEGLGKLKKSTSSGTQTGDLQVCRILPQPTTLPHVPGNDRRSAIIFSSKNTAFKTLKQTVQIIIYLNCKCVLIGGSGTTTRHNRQITHIKQNNTPHSNETQHTKIYK